MNNKFIKLDWNNYKEVQNKVNLIDATYDISMLNYLTWSHYGITIYFYDDNNAIYLYGQIDIKKQQIFNNELDSRNYDGNFVIFSPIYNKKDNINDLISKSIKILKEYTNNNQKEIYLINSTSEIINGFSDPIYETYANFIYLTESFKTFAGKKLQKKRNHLNFFINNYSNDILVKQFDISLKQEFLDFFKQEINDSETSGEYEYDVLKEVLDHYDDSFMSGTVIYYNNKIIGATLGIINNDIYEIFFERSDTNFRGSYQYLISSNLKINNINTKYVSRQDDAGMENIRKSKLSYYPIEIKKNKIQKLI